MKETTLTSLYQTRFFANWLMNPEDSSYNLSISYKLIGKLNLKRLKAACDMFIQNHSILYSQFNEDGTYFFQGNFDISQFYPAKNLTKGISPLTQIRQIINTPFDLINAPLARFYFLEDPEDAEITYFIYCSHHIIGDAVTGEVLCNEIASYYRSLMVDSAFKTLDKSPPYSQAILYESKYLDSQSLADASHFWQNYLKPETLSVNFPINSNAIENDKTGEVVFFEFNQEEMQRLKILAKECGATLFITISALFGLLLSKYSNQEQIILSYPINLRPQGFKNALGCFVNNLPLNIDIAKSQTLIELIQDIISHRRLAKKYQWYPIDKMVHDQHKLRKETNEYFNIGIVETNLSSLPFNLDGVEAVPIDIAWSDNSIYDLCLQYDPRDTLRLKFKFEYRKNKYNSEMLKNFIEVFQSLLVTATPELGLKNYIALTNQDYQKIIYQWNQTDVSSNLEHTVCDLFYEQVKSYPQQIAVSDISGSLSYNELNRLSNQLANFIRNSYLKVVGSHLKPDTPIVIFQKRSIDFAISILAVLKAGAAYVPIDPSYPDSRISYILNDCKAPFVICECIDKERLKVISPDLEVINYNRNEFLHENMMDLSIEIKPDHLAYIIYTSGTTGKPKGVMLEHAGLANLAIEQANKFEISSESNVLQFASISFDAAVSEFFTALIRGAKLYIASEIERKDDELLLLTLKNQQINVATIPPALLEQMEALALPDLKTLVVAGEKTSLNTIKRWVINRKIINAYGPTESTVCTTMHEYSENSLANNIGYPLANLKIYVLDLFLNPVPVGCIGELYVGGIGVARGYLNKPDLTAERFIPNKYASKNDLENNGYTKLYKTGDLVRYLTNGELEYIGRTDFQLKIRGHRVEIGEIISQLASFPGIEQCTIISKQRNNTNILIAYYTSSQSFDSGVLNNYLTEFLPDYMIPQYFIQLEQIPLTINGKVDLSALPEPATFSKLEEDIIKPITEMEKTIYAIWQSILANLEFSVTDDFFKIGGDSILAIQLLSKLRKAGFICNIKIIHDLPTVQKQAQYFTEHQLKPQEINAEQGVLTGEFELLPIQKWFFATKFKFHSHWNQAFIIKTPSLDINRLQEALALLAKHHDSLRLNFFDNFTKQAYRDIGSFQSAPLRVIDRNNLSNDELANTLSRIQAGFSIEKGDLWQVAYIHGYEDGTARVFFALHHLIIDAVSWRILTEDLHSLYNGEQLGQKTSSYRQWVNFISNYPDKFSNEYEYWTKIVAYQNLEYPDIQPQVEEVSLEFTEDFTRELLYEVNAAYNTEINDILLSALSYALYSWNGQSSQYITLEGHGRENLDPGIDLSRSVGWFTTHYPIQIEFNNEISTIVKEVKEILRRIPNKGIGYGAYKYSSQTNELNNHSLPPVSFNYLGQFNSTTDDIWQITNEKVGVSIPAENMSKNILEINGLVIDGKLQFSIRHKLISAAISIFRSALEQSLIKIVDHCKFRVANGQKQFTPYDFKGVNVSLNYLEYIYSKVTIQEILPLNNFQKELFYISQLSRNYQIETGILKLNLEMTDNLIQRYKDSWHKAINKHFCMRSIFIRENNTLEPITVILPEYKPEINLLQSEDLASAKVLLENEIDFCPRLGEFIPPYRLLIIQCKNGNNYLVFTFHHILLCGFSFVKILEDIDNLYKDDDAMVSGSIPRVINHDSTVAKQFWASYLEGFQFSPRVPALFSDHWRNKRYEITIDKKDYLSIAAVREYLPCSIAEYFQYGWAMALANVSGKSDILFTTTRSTRSELNIDPVELIGAFIATPVFRWNFTDHSNQDILKQLELVNKENVIRQQYASQEIFDQTFFSNYMFDTLFVFQNFAKSQPSLLLHEAEVNYTGSDYKMCLNIHEREDSFLIVVMYNFEYHTNESMLKIINEYKNVLAKKMPDLITETIAESLGSKCQE